MQGLLISTGLLGFVLGWAFARLYAFWIEDRS